MNAVLWFLWQGFLWILFTIGALLVWSGAGSHANDTPGGIIMIFGFALLAVDAVLWLVTWLIVR